MSWYGRDIVAWTSLTREELGVVGEEDDEGEEAVGCRSSNGDERGR